MIKNKENIERWEAMSEEELILLARASKVEVPPELSGKLNSLFSHLESQDQCLDVQDRSLQSQDQSLDVQDRCLQAQGQCLDVQDRCLQAQDQSLDVQDRCLQAQGRSKDKIRKYGRVSIYAFAGFGLVAACIAAVLMFRTPSTRPEDTFSSPEEAYAMLESTFSHIASKTGAATMAVGCSIQRVEDTINEIYR